MLVEKFNSKMMVRVYILCFLSFWAINSWGQEYNAQDSLSKTDSIPEQKPMQDSIPVSFTIKKSPFVHTECNIQSLIRMP